MEGGAQPGNSIKQAGASVDKPKRPKPKAPASNGTQTSRSESSVGSSTQASAKKPKARPTTQGSVGGSQGPPLAGQPRTSVKSPPQPPINPRPPAQRPPSQRSPPPPPPQQQQQRRYENGHGPPRPPMPQRPPPPAKDVEFNPTPNSTSIGSRPGLDSLSSVKSMGGNQSDTTLTRNEWVEINDDVYNMFFLSRVFGQAFWYGIYIFILKLTLYTFLALDAVDIPQPENISEQVLVTQFFMLPVAVAMQDDLIATYFMVANIKYSPLIKMQNPDATKWKFHVANFCRGVDGMYSLFVNFIILIKATEVLPLFLNFAALQFLQTIDNIALRLCADGYLSERLELVANSVMSTKLPNKRNRLYRSMDSILFLSTYSALLIAWAVISFG